MTHGALQVCAIAAGATVLVWSSPLYTASADTSTPSGATAARYPAHAHVRHYTHRTRYVWRNGHNDVYVHNYTYTNPYYPYTNVYYPAYGIINPVATVAAAVVDSIAVMGAIATYPIVCFPYYGSCPVHYSSYGPY